jgi:Sulfotransferase domain
VRVIGTGRTGTASLQVALETLGFGPCYHMIEVFKHPEHAATEFRPMIVVVRALSVAVPAALAPLVIAALTLLGRRARSVTRPYSASLGGPWIPYRR